MKIKPEQALPKKRKGHPLHKKGNDLYVLLTEWKNGLTLPVSKASKVELMGINQKITFSKKQTILTLQHQTLTPATIPTPAPRHTK